mgnify:CR=1 FL=1
MDISLILKITGIGLLVSVGCQVLSKSGRDEQATLLSIAGIIIVMLLIVGELNGLFSTLSSIFNFIKFKDELLSLIIIFLFSSISLYICSSSNPLKKIFFFLLKNPKYSAPVILPSIKSLFAIFFLIFSSFIEFSQPKSKLPIAPSKYMFLTL